MNIYLSCDSSNEFFINVIEAATKSVGKNFEPTAITLVYPPRRIGPDKGSVKWNTLMIRDADLVIFEVTPRVNEMRKEVQYNPGVMIEFGIVLDQDSPTSGGTSGRSWEGRLPKPSYFVFCSNKFSRTRLTPLLNEVSVIAYDPADSDKLEEEVTKLIKNKATERMNMRILKNDDGIRITQA